MKPVFIKFTDESEEQKVIVTHVTCSMKTGMMDQILDIGERADKLKTEGTGIAEVRQFYNDLNGLIVAVFGHKFTLEELKAGAEQTEVMAVFQELCARIAGEFQKN